MLSCVIYTLFQIFFFFFFPVDKIFHLAPNIQLFINRIGKCSLVIQYISLYVSLSNIKCTLKGEGEEASCSMLLNKDKFYQECNMNKKHEKLRILCCFPCTKITNKMEKERDLSWLDTRLIHSVTNRDQQHLSASLSFWLGYDTIRSFYPFFCQFLFIFLFFFFFLTF